MNERSLFLSALEIRDPAARAAYLDKECAGDTALRHRLDVLLSADANAGSFLAKPAQQDVTVDEPPITERPGSVIGPYKLMEQIGEGGMGLVFVAEQQHPVRRKVALKIIKPGMDSRNVIARFEAERQALALMDHPNIAKVLDAGTTGEVRSPASIESAKSEVRSPKSENTRPSSADLGHRTLDFGLRTPPEGRPYFVMELVKGIAITDYCDQNQLMPRERLSLFASVCQAVQHAHTKGVVHRDLKPSNILVTLHDGTPVVKVIDFGVAKAIGQNLTDKTIYTHFTQMIGTPVYMSPEQAEMSGLDIDTRSDVYSLGVLLYELLTGTTPFDRKRLHEAAFDEIRRIIREEEPPRPSTRLTTLGEGLSVMSAKRRTEPAKLSALFQGELDWIVMKALEKDRTRRYDTASAMAEDVRRFLNDELVQARPPSAWYRARKMAHRNKAAVTTAVLVAAALFVGTVVSVWQAVRATRAEADAVANADRAIKNETRAVAGEQLARDSEKKAAANADLAMKAAADAKDSEKKAAASAALATKHEQDARKQTKIAEGLHREAEGQLYATRITSAQRGLESNNVSLLYYYLDQCRQEFRGWEHDYLYTLANQSLQTLRGHTGGVRSVAFSPDGKHLASTSDDDKTVKLWDPESGQLVLCLDGGRKNYPNCVVFSPDGKRLACALDFPYVDKTFGEIKVWDTASGKDVLTLIVHNAYRISVAFSPDGKRLACGGVSVIGNKDGLGTVTLWDAANGGQPLTLHGHTDVVNSVAFSPDGRRLASASKDGTVKLWELASGQEYLTLKGDGDNFKSVAFSPDGKRLATASTGIGNGLKIWDAASGKVLLNPKGHTKNVNSVVFSPDGKRLASAFGDKTVGLWDVATGNEIETIKGHTNGVTSVAFSPDGKRLASASKDKTVKVWDAAGVQDALSAKLHEDKGFFRGLAISPDGKLLASARSADRASAGPQSPKSPYEVKLWDTASGQEVVILKGIKGRVDSVAFSPDGKLLASASSDRTVRLWDVATGHEIQTLKGYTGCSVTSVAFSPDGKLLASASAGIAGVPGEVKVWDAASGSALLTLKEHTGTVSSVVFSPDGKRLASAGDKTVKVWDAAGGQEIHTLVGHTAHVYGVAFSPDGKRLASASEDKTVKLWDAASGQVIQTLKGHTSYVKSVVFSPDGKRLASVSGDGTVKLWDAASGQDVLTLKTNFPGEGDVAFSPDGKRLVACGDKIIIWDASKSIADSSFHLNRLGISLAADNQLAEAITAFRKAIAIDPKFADAYFNLGNALRDKNQLAEAIAAYRKAIGIDPKNATVHYNLAWILATCADQKLRDPATALASAKKAIEFDDSHNSVFWGTLGAAHYRSGEWKEAIAALDKAVGKSAADCFFLAMAHRQLGHADEARAWYGKGVQWMTQNRTKDDEMQRFRAEAAELLGIPILDSLSKDMPVPKH